MVAVIAGLVAAITLAAPAPAEARACPSGHVALTFDDGPDEHTPDVLDVLAAHDVPAVFFVIGQKVPERPDLVQRAAAEGHEVANHSFTHRDLEHLTSDEIVAEVADTDQAIRATGVEPLPLLRPPFGSWDGPGGDVETAAASLGYAVVTWTVNPTDYQADADTIATRVLGALHDGANVLLHDGVSNAVETVAALPAIIDGARDAGYCFGLLDAAGEVVPAPSGRFVDIAGDTHEEQIERLAQADITRGCNPPVNDRFCPHDAVTRAEMASFLVRALGLSERAADRFVDVPVGSTHEADIERLAQADITRGCNPPENDRFCPHDAVTRAEMASFLVRAFLHG